MEYHASWPLQPTNMYIYTVYNVLTSSIHTRLDRLLGVTFWSEAAKASEAFRFCGDDLETASPTLVGEGLTGSCALT